MPVIPEPQGSQESCEFKARVVDIKTQIVVLFLRRMKTEIVKLMNNRIKDKGIQMEVLYNAGTFIRK